MGKKRDGTRYVSSVMKLKAYSDLHNLFCVLTRRPINLGNFFARSYDEVGAVETVVFLVVNDAYKHQRLGTRERSLNQHRYPIPKQSDN